MYSYGPPHMAKQKQDNQLEHTYSSYLRIRDVALKTCQKRWMIGRSGERGSGISVLVARHDDDYDDIYIYSHLLTDCIVVSLLFSVARHEGRLKLGSKSVQLYIRLSIITLSQPATYVSSGIIRHYVVAFVCLHFALPDTSFEVICITRVAAVNSFTRVLNSPGRWAYILSSADST